MGKNMEMRWLLGDILRGLGVRGYAGLLGNARVLNPN